MPIRKHADAGLRELPEYPTTHPKSTISGAGQSHLGRPSQPYCHDTDTF